MLGNDRLAVDGAFFLSAQPRCSQRGADARSHEVTRLNFCSVPRSAPNMRLFRFTCAGDSSSCAQGVRAAEQPRVMAAARTVRCGRFSVSGASCVGSRSVICGGSASCRAQGCQRAGQASALHCSAPARPRRRQRARPRKIAASRARQPAWRQCASGAEPALRTHLRRALSVRTWTLPQWRCCATAAQAAPAPGALAQPRIQCRPRCC